MRNNGPALGWEVFVAPGVATVSDDLPPNEAVRMWSPTSAILIFGERDAILVDTLTTAAQAKALADWVEKSGKNLTTIYNTHGHGDHFFGNGILLERFPAAKAVATPKVIEAMKRQTSPQVMAALWNKRFPNQLPVEIVYPGQLEGESLFVEDHELRVIDVGHTDTDDTTCLYAPSAGLVVAGDLAYNDVHQYFGESLTHEKRMAWITAIDKIETLNPRAVIAGHKREGRHDEPGILDETRQYILAFDRLVGQTSTVVELYERMLSLYPNRLNGGALWGSARAVKG